MQNSTLVFPIKGDRILLGKKKKGFGVGKWNGCGGKVGYGEEIEEAAERELWEECCVKARSLVKMAELTFIFPLKPEWNQVVHVFVSHEFHGEPTETEEMSPRWFYANKLPFNEMWPDDMHWLPKVLSGERVKGRFIFGSDNQKIDSFKLGEL